MTGNLDIPFPRGETYYNGRTIGTDLSAEEKLIGMIRTFNDTNPTTGVANSKLGVTCILLRNKHSVALTPSQAIRFSGTVIGESGAPVSALSQMFGVVDEYLPAAGVPVNDLFWCPIKGPALVNIVTVSGAKAAGQLPVQSSTTAGKVDFTDAAPGSDAIGQAAGGYGYRAFTAGALADQATQARIIMTNPFFGQ